MTAKDINFIIKTSEYQLQSENPFLEDYYYQHLMQRREPAKASRDLVFKHRHAHRLYYLLGIDIIRKLMMFRPICELFRPAGAPKQRLGEDPFVGALGRIPGHSVQTPFELNLSHFHYRFVHRALWWSCRSSTRPSTMLP